MKQAIPFSSLRRSLYILNLESGIVPKRNCHYVDQMAEKNKCRCNSLEEARKKNPKARFCKVCMRDEIHLDWTA